MRVEHAQSQRRKMQTETQAQMSELQRVCGSVEVEDLLWPSRSDEGHGHVGRFLVGRTYSVRAWDVYASASREDEKMHEGTEIVAEMTCCKALK